MTRFWKDTVERVLRTTVQTSAAAVLAVWIEAGSFNEIEWSVIWQVAAFAAGLTVLMALAGKGIGGDGDTGSVLPPK